MSMMIGGLKRPVWGIEAYEDLAHRVSYEPCVGTLDLYRTSSHSNTGNAFSGKLIS